MTKKEIITWIIVIILIIEDDPKEAKKMLTYLYDKISKK